MAVLLTSAATAIANTAHCATSYIAGWFFLNQCHNFFTPFDGFLQHSPSARA
jgi:hypothetical protein